MNITYQKDKCCQEHHSHKYLHCSCSHKHSIKNCVTTEQRSNLCTKSISL